MDFIPSVGHYPGKSFNLDVAVLLFMYRKARINKMKMALKVIFSSISTLLNALSRGKGDTMHSTIEE